MPSNPSINDKQEQLRIKNAEVDRLLALDTYSAKNPADSNTPSAKMVVLMAIAVGLFLWGTLSLGGHFLQQNRFAHEGVTTKGIVTLTSRSSSSSTATYIFRVNDRQYQHISYNYQGADADSSNLVSVRYLPTDPGQAEIVGRENYWSKILWYVFGIVLGGGTLLGTALQQRKNVIPVYDSNEVLEGPEWATKPYQSVVAQKSRRTDPEPVEEEQLNALPGEQKL